MFVDLQLKPNRYLYKFRTKKRKTNYIGDIRVKREKKTKKGKNQNFKYKSKVQKKNEKYKKIHTYIHANKDTHSKQNPNKNNTTKLLK